MKRTLAFGGVVATAGLLASALVAPAQAAPSGQDPVGRTWPAKDPVSQINFWLDNNAKALRDATEYHPDYKLDVHTSRLKSKGGPAPDGKPGLVAPTGEGKKVVAKIKNINLPKSIGKVFFWRDGKPYWCSGTAVHSRYGNIVATAGHCVYNTNDDDHVLDHWVFVPGYYQGKAPWGIFLGKAGYTHYDFDVYEDYDRDYAFVSVYNGIKIRQIFLSSHAGYDRYLGPKWQVGEKYYIAILEDVGTLQKNVGGQGFAYNLKRNNYVYTFGYPAGEHEDGNKPYTGITPKWCYGKTSLNVVDAKLKIEEQIGLKCSVTPGYDGGPWLYRYNNTKRTGYVNGVTSTFIDADDNDRYEAIGSPYFDGETALVYKAAANTWSGSLLDVKKVLVWDQNAFPTPSPSASTSPSPTPTPSPTPSQSFVTKPLSNG